MITLTDYDNGTPILIRLDLLGEIYVPADNITRVRTTLGNAFRVKEEPKEIKVKYEAENGLLRARIKRDLEKMV